MSFLKNIFGTAQKPRTMLDDVQEVVAKLTIKGYRKIAAQHGCAPTAKTSDLKIMEVYSKVLKAFHQAEQQRGEHISAVFKNYIVLKFLQGYEMHSEQHMQEHLQYEVDKFLREGLRPDYQKELPLFDPDSNDPDVKRLRELQRLTREKLLSRSNEDEQHRVQTMSRQMIGLCPKCKYEILEESAGYFCRAQGCGFKLGGIIMGQVLNSTQAVKLFRDGRTDLLSEFIAESGRQFSAWLVIDESGDVRFDFPKQAANKVAEPNPPDARQQVDGSDEWGAIIEEIVEQFRERRIEWFTTCIVLLKSKAGLRTNPRLEGRAEIATWVYQCATALSFISERQYIPPENGRAFATMLFSALSKDGQQNLPLAKELYKLQLAALERKDGADVLELCGLITEQILLEPGALAALKLANTIPIFKNFSNSVIAQAFGDTAMARRLFELK